MQIKIDRLVRSRRKTIAILVQSDGKLVVRAPLLVSETRINKFIDSKRDWITAQQKKAAARQVPHHEYKDGESFLFLGDEIPLKLVERKDGPLSLGKSFLFNKSQAGKAEIIFTLWYRRQAREIFANRVKFLAHKFGYSYGRIRLSSARSRWGSCSSKGTLSFTWRLVMAPVEVIDYVILHELTHLEIRNHSRAFWAKVEGYVPDYRKKRLWLKVNGHRLVLGD
jgi:hypothetical protein